MANIIILRTTWTDDYWDSPKDAPYRASKSYREIKLPEWDSLLSNCPLPALGIYIRDYEYKEFVYLKIKGMKFEEKNEQVYFSFEPISKSKSASRRFIERFPNSGLFSAMQSDGIIDALREMGEEPPEEWIKLIREEKPSISWRDFVGNYFLGLTGENLSNNEFEDRCFNLLKAIGFDVKQQGYKIRGEYPDGEIHLDDDTVIVYDCKNINNFIPNADDKRKLNDYIRNSELRYRDKRIYGAFIARSIARYEKQTDLFLFPADKLIYLLYKRIILGKEFALSPFRIILENRIILDKTLIDNEWRE